MDCAVWVTFAEASSLFGLIKPVTESRARYGKGSEGGSKVGADYSARMETRIVCELYLDLASTYPAESGSVNFMLVVHLDNRSISGNGGYLDMVFGLGRTGRSHLLSIKKLLGKDHFGADYYLSICFLNAINRNALLILWHQCVSLWDPEEEQTRLLHRFQKLDREVWRVYSSGWTDRMIALHDIYYERWWREIQDGLLVFNYGFIINYRSIFLGFVEGFVFCGNSGFCWSYGLQFTRVPCKSVYGWWYNISLKDLDVGVLRIMRIQDIIKSVSPSSIELNQEFLYEYTKLELQRSGK